MEWEKADNSTSTTISEGMLSPTPVPAHPRRHTPLSAISISALRADYQAVIASYCDSFFTPSHLYDHTTETIRFPRVRDFGRRRPRKEECEAGRKERTVKGQKREPWLPRLSVDTFLRRMYRGDAWTLISNWWNADLFHPNYAVLDLDIHSLDDEDEFWQQVQRLKDLQIQGKINVVWTTSPGDLLSTYHVQGLYAWLKWDDEIPGEVQCERLNTLLPLMGLGGAGHRHASNRLLTRLPGQPYVQLCDPDPATRDLGVLPPDHEFIRAYTQAHRSSHPQSIERLAYFWSFATAWHNAPTNNLDDLIERFQVKNPVAIQAITPETMRAEKSIKKPSPLVQPPVKKPKSRSTRKADLPYGWSEKTPDELKDGHNTFDAWVKHSKEFSRVTHKYRGDLNSLPQALTELEDTLHTCRPSTSRTCGNRHVYQRDITRIGRWFFTHYDPAKKGHVHSPEKEEADKARFVRYTKVRKGKLLNYLLNRRRCSSEIYQFVFNHWYDMMVKWNGRISYKAVLENCGSYSLYLKLIKEMKKLGLRVALAEYDKDKNHCRQYGYSEEILEKCAEGRGILSSTSAPSPRNVDIDIWEQLATPAPDDDQYDQPSRSVLDDLIDALEWKPESEGEALREWGLLHADV